MQFMIDFPLTPPSPPPYREILGKCAPFSREGTARDGTGNCQVQVGDQFFLSSPTFYTSRFSYTQHIRHLNFCFSKWATVLIYTS